MPSGREARIAAYQAIENYRDRPLIAYATSTRPNVNALMAGDAVREIADQVRALPASHKAVDVLVSSYGGDGIAAWRIMCLLRERFEKVAVLVPFDAMSAATLLAFGADEIVMHPFAALGPTDPQIQFKTKDGDAQFAFEDVGAFLRFLREDARISEQAHLGPIVEKVFGAGMGSFMTIGLAKRSSDLASDMGERMLRMHMRGAKAASRAKEIAKSLNRGSLHHGDSLSRERARKLGLPISKNDEALEALLWTALEKIEDVFDSRSQFDMLSTFCADQAAANSIAPAAPLVLPPNTPQQAADNAWNAVLNNAIQRAATGTGREVPFQLAFALVESPRKQRIMESHGKISAARIGLDVKSSAIFTRIGWRDSD
jgi:hypothetical protein